MTFLRSTLLVLLLLLLLTAAFLFGYATHAHIESSPDFPILNEAYQALLENGLYDPPPNPALEYGMIHGMAGAYGDPYTRFVEPPQQELENDRLAGKFGGIGAQLGKDTDGFWVLFPFPDGPASQAGIQEGDRLLEVDGTPVTPKTPADDIKASIRGPVGEPVTLTTGIPPDYTPIEIIIERAEFPLPSVAYHLDLAKPEVGVVKVNLIAATTTDEIVKAVQELQERGATHFVLDLRDNPGGLLDTGVDIARLFLEDGIVLQKQYRGQDIETQSVERPGPLVDIPLAVLINHLSASAAEIAAGALQTHQRAALVGSPSFGKDTIQLVCVMSDDSSLHVTSARWWVPGLEPPIGDDGLLPDIPVDPSNQENQDAVLVAAIKALLSK